MRLPSLVLASALLAAACGGKAPTAASSTTSYQIRVVVSPSIGGTVTMVPVESPYTSGTTVTLTATAAPGYQFVRWEGDTTGTGNATTVVMNGNRSVTAVFVMQAAYDALSGKIEDLQAAQDIIDWNMKALGGGSYRRRDMISRWDLPVPVFIADNGDGARVVAALEYWKAATGLSYVLLPAETSPRALIRFGMDGLPAWGGARSVVDGTAPNNRAISGLVVYQPGGGTMCIQGSASLPCLALYRHELGHIFGIFVNTPVGLMGGSGTLTDREIRMLNVLYSLPFGARVEPDGRWNVVGAP